VRRVQPANPACYHSGMTLAPKIGIALGGLALTGVGAVLWLRFGGLVYFDMLAASFVGCFL
jgi:hypothetical protein